MSKEYNMKKKHSYFKNPQQDIPFLENWVTRLEKANGYNYENIQIATSLGKTIVWGLNTENRDLETLVIFPGFRTSALFWDFDRGLEHLQGKYRIFMVETNGQPNLSEGYSPAIKSNDYGKWACEVLDQLLIEKTYIAGASFGGLVCMKLCITNPERVKAVFLLNPACFRMISLSLRNLYNNLLPVFFPNHNNLSTFLDSVVFCKPDHKISPEAENLFSGIRIICY